MHNTGKKLLALLFVAMCIAGCGGSKNATTNRRKVFTYGTIAYGPQHNDVGLNPHEGYSGWSTVRYGVGETLLNLMMPWSPDTGWLKAWNTLMPKR